MDKKAVVFDFDNTMDIKTDEYPAIGRENWLMFNVIKSHIKSGDVIILNTMREGELLDEAVNWLKARGIVPDVINDNYEPRQKAYGNNPRKVGGDVIYDDMNFSWGSVETISKLIKVSGDYKLEETNCKNCRYWNGKESLDIFWCERWERKNEL